MPRIRFSLAAFMGLVFLAAVGLVALRNASPAWANATFTATLTLLLCAVLGLIFRRHHARAFWLGFALFGWTYVLLVNAPSLGTQVRPRLITDSGLSRLHKSVLRAQGDSANPDQGDIVDLTDVALNSSNAVFIRPLRDLHLSVGRARILRAPFKIKRIQVSDENVVDLIPLTRPTDIQLAAIAAGATYLSLWDASDRVHNVSVVVGGSGSVPNIVHFHRVGHSLFAVLFAVLFALLGGYVAVCFYRRENQSATSLS